jgi:hypothetical protein
MGSTIIALKSIERTSDITYAKASRRRAITRYSSKPNIRSTEMITSYEPEIIRMPISVFLQMKEAKELCMGSEEFFELAKECITQIEGKRERPRRKARQFAWLEQIFG